jgi:pimeloyl-ACP methyl ester carboxylesterase
MGEATRDSETFVTAGGLKLFVRERGAGHPLLLINGIGANTEMWGNTEDVLCQGSRTIAFDCPGTGRSDTSMLPLSMAALARVVVAALDELGHERVDVMGFSFGGTLAQQLAYEAPERVRRLALVSTACGWGATLGRPSAVMAVSSPLRYYSSSWYHLTNRFLGEPDSDRAGSLGRFANRPSPLGYTYQLWALASWSSRSWLHRVEAPTLVVSGERDLLIPPSNAVQMARLLGDSRLHLLPDEAHLLLFNRNSNAPQLLADFFASPTLDHSSAWTTGQPIRTEAMEQAA